MLRGGGNRPGPSDAGGKADAGAGAEADGTGGLATEAPGVAAITRPASAVSATRPPRARPTDLRGQPWDAGPRTLVPASGPAWPLVTAERLPPPAYRH